MIPFLFSECVQLTEMLGFCAWDEHELKEMLVEGQGLTTSEMNELADAIGREKHEPSTYPLDDEERE